MSSRLSPEKETHIHSFLNQLSMGLRQVREDRKALWLSLRSTCQFFKATDGCLAVLPAACS